MKFLLFIFSYFIASSCYSKKIEVDIFKKDEINIENFGFSYCLTKTKDKVLLSESSLAMGGYFQEGAYEEPAYKKALLHKPISKGLFHNIILK